MAKKNKKIARQLLTNSGDVNNLGDKIIHNKQISTNKQDFDLFKILSIGDNFLEDTLWIGLHQKMSKEVDEGILEEEITKIENFEDKLTKQRAELKQKIENEEILFHINRIDKIKDDIKIALMVLNMRKTLYDKNTEEAEKYIKKILEIDPHNAHANAAANFLEENKMTKEELKKHKEQRKKIRKEHKFDDYDFITRLAGELDSSMEKTAIKNANKVLRYDPYNPAAHKFLKDIATYRQEVQIARYIIDAEHALKTENFKGFMENYNKIININHDSPEAFKLKQKYNKIHDAYINKKLDSKLTGATKALEEKDFDKFIEIYNKTNEEFSDSTKLQGLYDQYKIKYPQYLITKFKNDIDKYLEEYYFDYVMETYKEYLEKSKDNPNLGLDKNNIIERIKDKISNKFKKAIVTNKFFGHSYVYGTELNNFIELFSLQNFDKETQQKTISACIKDIETFIIKDNPNTKDIEFALNQYDILSSYRNKDDTKDEDNIEDINKIKINIYKKLANLYRNPTKENYANYFDEKTKLNPDDTIKENLYKEIITITKNAKDDSEITLLTNIPAARTNEQMNFIKNFYTKHNLTLKDEYIKLFVDRLKNKLSEDKLSEYTRTGLKKQINIFEQNNEIYNNIINLDQKSKKIYEAKIQINNEQITNFQEQIKILKDITTAFNDPTLKSIELIEKTIIQLTKYPEADELVDEFNAHPEILEMIREKNITDLQPIKNAISYIDENIKDIDYNTETRGRKISDSGEFIDMDLNTKKELSSETEAQNFINKFAKNTIKLDHNTMFGERTNGKGMEELEELLGNKKVISAINEKGERYLKVPDYLEKDSVVESIKDKFFRLFKKETKIIEENRIYQNLSELIEEKRLKNLYKLLKVELDISNKIEEVKYKYNKKYRTKLYNDFYYDNLRNLTETEDYDKETQYENILLLIGQYRDSNEHKLKKNKYGRTILSEAAKKGFDDILNYLINQGENINEIDYHGYTPLISAIKHNNSNTTKTLINNGSDIEIKNKDGYTALHLAVEMGDDNTIELLLKHGANINIQNKEGETPLYIATKVGSDNIINLLIKHGANLNIEEETGNTPLANAILSRKYNISKLLIDSGADINKISRFGTPLHLLIQALSHGYDYETEEKIIELIKLLIDNGADLNITDDDGDTVLHKALNYGDITIIKLLLDNNAQVNIPNKRGETPLYLAIKEKNEYETKLLMEHGAKIDTKNKINDTLLNDTLDNGNYSISKLLIENGANLNKPSGRRNFTPLHILIESLRYDEHNNLIKNLIKLILEKGADLSIIDDNGNTILHTAIKYGDIDIIKLILEYDISQINVRNSYSRTPLHLATEENQIDKMNLLINHGADLNIKGNKGMTALHIAIEGRSSKATNILIKNNASTDIQDDNRNTALHFAISKEINEVAINMIKNGANIDIKNKEGHTPLFLAINNKNNVIAKLLIDKRKNDDIENKGLSGVLSFAIKSGNYEITKYLVDMGEDKLLKTHKEETTKKAIESGDTEIMRFIIEYNNNIVFEKNADILKPEKLVSKLHKFDVLYPEMASILINEARKYVSSGGHRPRQQSDKYYPAIYENIDKFTSLKTEDAFRLIRRQSGKDKYGADILKIEGLDYDKIFEMLNFRWSNYYNAGHSSSLGEELRKESADVLLKRGREDIVRKYFEHFEKSVQEKYIKENKKKQEAEQKAREEKMAEEKRKEELEKSQRSKEVLNKIAPQEKLMSEQGYQRIETTRINKDIAIISGSRYYSGYDPKIEGVYFFIIQKGKDKIQRIHKNANITTRPKDSESYGAVKYLKTTEKNNKVFIETQIKYGLRLWGKLSNHEDLHEDNFTIELNKSPELKKA